MMVVAQKTFTLKNSAMPMPQTIHPTSLPFALANASNTNAALRGRLRYALTLVRLHRRRQATWHRVDVFMKTASP